MAIIFRKSRNYVSGDKTKIIFSQDTQDVNYSFLQSIQDASNADSYTFSNQSLGDAASNRYIIVTVYCRRAETTPTSISGITVGGVSATVVVSQQHIATNQLLVAIAIAAVPTGTTGDVVVTFSQSQNRCVIGMYRVTGLNSATAHDTASSTADPTTGNLDIPAGGVAVAMSAHGFAETASWTNLDEDFDIEIESTTCSGASKKFNEQQTGLTITCTWSGTAAEPAGVFASWR